MNLSGLIRELQDIQRRAGDLAEVVVRTVDEEKIVVDEVTFHGGSTVELRAEVPW